MRRLGMLLGTLLFATLLVPASGSAWHKPSLAQASEIAEAAEAEVEDVRISRINERWASAVFVSPPVTMLGYFRREAGGWREVAASSGCLNPTDIPGISNSVALELGACREQRPVPLVPYSLFAFGPESRTGEDPGHIDLSVSACAPIFYGLRWTSYSSRHATAVGRGRFPYFPATGTSCESAPVHRPLVHLLLSRPRQCAGALLFTEIRWRGSGERGSFHSICRSPY
jgi:hypothetical protein